MLTVVFNTYQNLLLHIALSLSITLILTLLKIPIRFLQGLNTYIHPENVANDKTQSGFRPAIRRPSETNNEGVEGYQNLNSSSEPRKRVRSKDKFEFDESNAQIFRLHLTEAHIRSRLYFSHYRDVFYYSFLAGSSILLHGYLPVPEESGVLVSGSFYPALLGFVAVVKVVLVIGKVSFERSASKRSEKQLSVVLGGLGFVLAFSILYVIAPSVFDFNFDSVDGSGKVWVALLAGCLAGFLFMPSAKSARSLWLGTDQLRWNLSIISCGWFARFLLYVNIIVGIFTSLLWINPIAEILINKGNFDSSGVSSNASDHEYATNGKLAGNIGMLQSDFEKVRLWCLVSSGVLQILTLRPSLQMYLNEAVLCWYQRLHASKVPDLDFSRAKIFLHNYYACLVALQFFAPSALILLFLGLTQIQEGNLLMTFPVLCNFIPCSAFVKEVALFMAWWVVFVCAIFSSSSLVLFRGGFLYVS